MIAKVKAYNMGYFDVHVHKSYNVVLIYVHEIIFCEMINFTFRQFYMLKKRMPFKLQIFCKFDG